MKNRAINLSCAAIIGFLPLALLHGQRISGINLSSVEDWSTELVFTNAFQQSREWIVHETQAGAPWESSATIPLLPNGYPQQVPYQNGGVSLAVRTLMLWDIGNTYPSGNYRLVVSGTGRVRLWGAASGTFQCPVNTLVSVNPANGGVALEMEQSSASDPIRDIKFIFPQYVNTYQNQEFTSEILDFVSDFQTLRFMDWAKTNGSSVVSWADRTPSDYYTQAKSSGASWEKAIRLCNTASKNAWINIPHQADDQYIQQLATLFRDSLNPNLKIYLEYSNELWNGAFSQQSYAAAAAQALGYSGQSWERAWKYTAKRSADVFHIFGSVFGSTQRLVRVIPSQAANSWLSNEIITFFKSSQYNPNQVGADALAIAPYFGNEVADQIASQGLVNSITVPQIITRLRNALADSYTWMQDQKAVADQHNLKLVAYECGAHLVATGNNTNNGTLTNKLISANRDTALQRMYCEYSNYWYQTTQGDLFCYFSSHGLYSQWGSWGLKETMTDTLSPRYLALQQCVFSSTPALPTLASFTPTSASTGNAILLKGARLTGATAVHFGGTSAVSFSVIDSETIIATVGAGNSGSVSVTTPGGTASLAGFTFLSTPSPTIRSFSPTEARTGVAVRIHGSNLAGTTAVRFGGTHAASFTVVNDTTLLAVVGNGSSGAISVTTPGGMASSGGFTFLSIPVPAIHSFTPLSAQSGQTVTLQGSNFTGASSVRFGGVAAASFSVQSANTLTAVVGSGASGTVTVTTPGGTASRAGFAFFSSQTPSISSFSPTSAMRGRSVLISGNHFSGTSAVHFGGVPAASFTVLSPTTLIAIVGQGASGDIQVTTPAGSTSRAGFTFLVAGIPAIHSFTPTSATTGASIDISGTNFSGATAVQLGAAPAASFKVNSPTSITAVVGSGASGIVSVTTPGGTGSSSGSFTYIAPPAPTLSSFTPVAARQGQVVTIRGTQLRGATSVQFGSSKAASFSIVSASSITAVVGSGGSGAISVTTPGGTATISGFSFLTSSAPVIASFTPISAQSGQAVLIKGAHFKLPIRVYFGGVAARSVALIDSTTLAAVVGSGASGNVSVTTGTGTAIAPGFSFLSTPLAQTEEMPAPAHRSSANGWTEWFLEGPDKNAASPLSAPALFTLYPNPSGGEVQIRLGTDWNTERPTLRILDFLGREVLRIPYPETDVLSLNLSGFVSGIYHVFLLSSNTKILGRQALLLH